MSARGGEPVLRRTAVTALGPDLGSPVDPLFGRCRYFVIVDDSGALIEVVENVETAVDSGAGARAVQVLVTAGVSTVLTGRCGPTATRALAAAGIEAVPGCEGTVAEVLRERGVGARGLGTVPGSAPQGPPS